MFTLTNDGRTNRRAGSTPTVHHFTNSNSNTKNPTLHPISVQRYSSRMLPRTSFVKAALATRIPTVLPDPRATFYGRWIDLVGSCGTSTRTSFAPSL
jgi:hypothetical protein